jgi:hypothetical protein
MCVKKTVPGMRRRRVIALGLMLALAGSAVEALAGPVRDGSMHHETIVEASSHRFVLGVQHDHDAPAVADAPAPDDASSASSVPSSADDEHEHSGDADHCSHVHGFALVGTTEAMSAVVVSDPGDREIMPRHERSETLVLRPPRV